MTRDADPAVIDAMRKERIRHALLSGMIPAQCACAEWSAMTSAGARAEWVQWSRHVEERVLAAALAVTACTNPLCTDGTSQKASVCHEHALGEARP